MRRRALLASLAALAGCAGANTDAGQAGTTAAGTGTTTEPSETTDEQSDDSDGHSLTESEVVTSAVAPRTYALPSAHYRHDRGTVRLSFESTATEAGPARVGAVLTNEAAHEQTYRLAELPPLAAPTARREPQAEIDADGSDSDDAVAFAPTANHDLVDDPPAVELADGYWHLADAESPGESLPGTVTLAPEESVYGEYALVGRSADDGRPPGVYEFRGRGDDVALAVWNTDEPGPERSSRFAGESVPSLDEGSVFWFHETDSTTPSFVLPERERASLPAAVDFRFVNRTRETLECGHWYLFKLVDGEWFRIGPLLHTADCRLVSAGGTVDQRLRAANGEALSCSDSSAHTFGHLGGGRYGYVVGYGHEGMSGAMVEFEAPPVDIVPTDDVVTERDGATVTVTASDTGADSSDPPLVVERVGDADAERLIAEQVMRPSLRRTRNALAAFEEGVDRVVVRTADRGFGPSLFLDSDDDTVRIRVRGETYEVREGTA